MNQMTHRRRYARPSLLGSKIQHAEATPPTKPKRPRGRRLRAGNPSPDDGKPILREVTIMSRNISEKAADAFDRFQDFKQANTRVQTDERGARLYLHENLIAEHNDKGQIYFTLAGWPTPTTRERLNAIYGLRITQKAGVQYANGVKIDPERWYLLTPCATIKEV